MDLGLTQRTLATKLGCWDQTVAAWERDESLPLANRWRVLEALLGRGLVPEREGLPGRIRAARLWLGLTQDAVARQAMLDVRTVRNAELGIRSPNRLTLRRLGAVLGSVA